MHVAIRVLVEVAVLAVEQTVKRSAANKNACDGDCMKRVVESFVARHCNNRLDEQLGPDATKSHTTNERR